MTNADLKRLLAAGADGREVTIVDSASPLKIRKSKNGKVSYRVRWQEGGKRRSVTLGQAPAMSLTQARDAANQLVSQRRLAKAGVLAAPVAAEPEPVAPSISIQQACDEWRAEQTGIRDTTREKHELACRHITDAVGNKTVTGFARGNAVRLLDRYRDRPCSHNEVISVGERVWQRLLLRELADVNPWTGIPRMAERSRETVLPVSTLVDIWEEAGHPRWGNSGLLFRFMIATGCRRGEARHAKFEMVGADTITIPPEYTKCNKPTVLTITPLAESVLSDIKRLNGKSQGLLLPGARGGKIRTDNRHQSFSAAVGLDPKAWRCHDFRRSIVTALVDLDLVDAVSADAMLGHSPSSLSSVARVYNRSLLRRQARTAAHTWSEFFLEQLRAHRRNRSGLKAVG